MLAAAAQSIALPAAGARVAVRLATGQDVPALIELINRLASEARLLFVVPVDPETGADDLRQFLLMTAASGNNAVLVACERATLIGLATATGGVHPAKRAAVEIGIGVLAAHQGYGVGRALMAGLEAWARAAGIRRLQLPVVTTNAPAIALYRKCGFALEGTLRESAWVEGRHVDQYMMAKLLDA